MLKLKVYTIPLWWMCCACVINPHNHSLSSILFDFCFAFYLSPCFYLPSSLPPSLPSLSGPGQVMNVRVFPYSPLRNEQKFSALVVWDSLTQIESSGRVDYYFVNISDAVTGQLLTSEFDHVSYYFLPLSSFFPLLFPPFLLPILSMKQHCWALNKLLQIYSFLPVLVWWTSFQSLW